MNRSSNPASANTSASPTVATVRPTAPASICRRANATLLCVFVCGRRATPRSRIADAIDAIRASAPSRSTTTYGVSSAAVSAGSSGPIAFVTSAGSPPPARTRNASTDRPIPIGSRRLAAPRSWEDTPRRPAAPAGAMDRPERQEGRRQHDDLAPARPRAGESRRGRSRPVGGDARGAPAPARQDRADRERELRVGRGARSPGFVADEQVRRGPSGQALLRRLRVRRRGGAARPGACAGALPRAPSTSTSSPTRRPGQHGRLLQRPPARRPDDGHEPRPRRPPHPRDEAQLQRAAVRGPPVRRPSGHRADRLRRDGGAGPRGAPEAHRRWRLGLSAAVGLRADGRHRPFGRRAPLHRHGPRRRPRRCRHPPEPVPARRHRHDDDAQDAPRRREAG